VGETRFADIPGALPFGPVLLHSAGAGAGEEAIVFVAPFDCRIVKVICIPAAAITGADTNYAVLTLYNRGKDGAGTTALVTKNFTAGVDWPAHKKQELYAPSPYLALEKDTVLELVKGDAGTGMATPHISVFVLFESQ